MENNQLLVQEPSAEPGKSEYGKVFLITSSAGASFGLIASIIMLQLDVAPWPPLPFIVTVLLATGLFSGCAGLGAATLENRLAVWGVKSAPIRLVISFGAVAILTMAIIYIGVTALGGANLLAEVQRYSFWATVAGMVFGAVFALISYRSGVMRQKLQLLEMENRHLADLASREELLREAARNLAVAEERNRMARELHDSISQGVHGIVYSLRSLRNIVADNPRGMEILGHLEETADGTLKELRRLVMELTPSSLEEDGLEEALRLHCDLFARRQKVELNLDLDYSGQLQPEQEVAIYRITQEALANVQKHAAAASIHISLHSGAETVLEIRDNGKGFAAQGAKTGHGLNNMSSRARLSGGTLALETAPGQGTAIIVRFPSFLCDSVGGR